LKKIIGLAAPARSGKDTVASLLRQHQQVISYALADPLKIGCQSLFGLTDAETWGDANKEKRIPLWQRSPRQLFQLTGTEWMRSYNSKHWLMRAEQQFNMPDHLPVQTIPVLNDKRVPFKLAAQAFFGLSDDQTWDVTQTTVKNPFWGITPKQMFQLLESMTLNSFNDYFEQRSQRPITLSSRIITPLNTHQIMVISDIRFENEANFVRQHQGQIWHIIRHNAKKVNDHSSERGVMIKEEDVIINNNSTLEILAQTVDQAWNTVVMPSDDPFC